MLPARSPVQGFTNAKWVDGELLVFAGDSAFVRGAQLGFTFDVHANQRWVPCPCSPPRLFPPAVRLQLA